MIYCAWTLLKLQLYLKGQGCRQAWGLKEGIVIVFDTHTEKLFVISGRSDTGTQACRTQWFIIEL